jgi:hypothetical protein
MVYYYGFTTFYLDCLNYYVIQIENKMTFT